MGEDARGRKEVARKPRLIIAQSYFSGEAHKSTAKVAITIDQATLGLTNQWKEECFQVEGEKFRKAISDELARLKRSRLATESAKLDPAFEKSLADEGMSLEPHEWPEYVEATTYEH